MLQLPGKTGLPHSLSRICRYGTRLLREEVESIAATGAVQFDTVDLNQLHVKDDYKKPEYATVVTLLNRIRDQNDAVKYVYVLRPTPTKNMFEFVADADSLNPNAKKD